MKRRGHIKTISNRQRHTPLAPSAVRRPSCRAAALLRILRHTCALVPCRRLWPKKGRLEKKSGRRNFPSARIFKLFSLLADSGSFPSLRPPPSLYCRRIGLLLLFYSIPHYRATHFTTEEDNPADGSVLSSSQPVSLSSLLSLHTHTQRPAAVHRPASLRP